MTKKKKNEKTIFVSGNPEPRTNFLIEQKENFRITRTNKTVKLTSFDKVKMHNNKPLIKISYLYRNYKEKPLGYSFFGLVNELKKIVLLNADKVDAAPFACNPFNIKYYDFKRSLRALMEEAGGVYDLSQVYEADITKAYYRAALNLGFITPDFYAKCLELPKVYRLRLIGSMATVRLTSYYEEGELVKKMPPEENPTLRDAWFKICSYVDQALQTFKNLLGENFLFYWVDGIYFKNDELNPELAQMGYKNNHEFILEQLNEKFSFDWKLKIIDKMQMQNRGDYFKITMHEKDRKRPRVFCPPFEKIKYYNIDNSDQFNF